MYINIVIDHTTIQHLQRHNGTTILSMNETWVISESKKRMYALLEMRIGLVSYSIGDDILRVHSSDASKCPTCGLGTEIVIVNSLKPIIGYV